MRAGPAARSDLSLGPGMLMKVLGNEVRWGLVGALGLSDRKVNELVERVQQPANLVSYHLGQLRAARIVTERRSSADARDVYYSLDLERLQAAFQRSASAIHPGLWPELGPSRAEKPSGDATSGSIARVLFVCTHNSARSQMAEAILRYQASGAVEVRSAGSHPSHVHPLAAQALVEQGIDTEGLHSKPLSQFAGDRFDYVITLCDVVREACPSWTGEPEQVHWSLPDPSLVDASEEAALLAFRSTAVDLARRVRYFLAVLQRAQGSHAA